RPDGVDLLAIVAGSAGPAPVPHAARLWLADGRAQGLRRRATVLSRLTVDGVDGDLVAVELPSTDVASRWIAGHGPDAVVLEPPALAHAVRERLLAAAGRAG
ncbi:MAG: WYL domain-containing protein, partial [Pseudonocardiaceae bacterium]